MFAKFLLKNEKKSYGHWYIIIRFESKIINNIWKILFHWVEMLTGYFKYAQKLIF